MSELDTYIINNYMNYSYEELANMLGMSKNAIKCRVQRLIKKYNLKNKNKVKHTYTKEQDEWLKIETHNHTYITLCNLFNEKFNANETIKSLQRHCLDSLGIRIDKNFKGDYNHPISKKIGYERESEGYLWVKAKNNMCGAKKNWMLKQRYVWEQYYGAIPEGYKIVFLDGNCLNCDISNLYCVPVSIQMSLNYVPHNPSLRRCKIKSCILKDLLEGYKNI